MVSISVVLVFHGVVQTQIFAIGSALPEEGERNALVIPSYKGHLSQWTGFITSINQMEKCAANNGDACSSRNWTVHTIVSHASEVDIFNKVMSGLCTFIRCRIHTLEDVIALSGRSIAMTRVSRDKNTWQSMKKVFGCYAFTSPGGVCFAADSESMVVRPVSICSIVDEFRRHKAIFRSPVGLHMKNTNHKQRTNQSRMLLNRTGDVSMDRFGNFYTIEVYNWIWDGQVIKDFVDFSFQGRGWWEEAGHYIEESVNHFIYMNPTKYGYNFIDIYKEITRITPKWFVIAKIRRTWAVEKMSSTLAGLMKKYNATADVVERIGRLFKDNGMPFINSAYNQSDTAARIFFKAADVKMCLSESSFVCLDAMVESCKHCSVPSEQCADKKLPQLPASAKSRHIVTVGKKS